MNKKGIDLIKTYKYNKTKKLPLITEFSQTKKLCDFGNEIFNLENNATNQYALFSPTPLNCNLEKTRKLIVLN